MTAIDIDSSRPPERDPAQSAFWETYYAANNRPWQVEVVPSRLKEHIDKNIKLWRDASVLIPGRGLPYEIEAIHESARSVVAIDFSKTAVAQAKIAFPSMARSIHFADFFEFNPRDILGSNAHHADTHESSYRIVYERAFLCGLPKRARESYASTMAELVAPGGVLLGFFYLSIEEEKHKSKDDVQQKKGPPYAMSRTELDALLVPNFICEVDETGNEDHPVFRNASRFMVWRRE
jgi:hypothetical protein